MQIREAEITNLFIKDSADMAWRAQRTKHKGMERKLRKFLLPRMQPRSPEKLPAGVET